MRMKRWVAASLVVCVQLSALRVARADVGTTVAAQLSTAALDPLHPPTAQPASMPLTEHMRAQEKAAELTPIVPSPHDLTKPAYQLYTQLDIPIVGIGAVLAAARFVRTQPAFCAPLCDKSTLNVVDKATAGIYDAGVSLASDVGLYSIMGGAALLMWIDEGFWPGLNDIVVVAESGLMATALSALAELANSRPRLFLYGTAAPLKLRNSSDAGLSFVSGHATVTFAVAVSTYITMRRLHPEKGTIIPIAVLLIGLGAAGFVASARVVAGMHFITDSIAGAVVGTAVGIIVPSLHGSPIRIIPTVNRDGAQVSVGGQF